VVEEHAEPSVGRGGEATHRVRQGVGAADRLHHDSRLAQLLAPHLLDQLRIVEALHVDPVGAGDLRRLLRTGDGARRGAPRLARALSARGRCADERRRLILDEEAATPQREHALSSPPVPQQHPVTVQHHDLAAEARRPILHDGARDRGDLLRLVHLRTPAIGTG
jgi:hypothetical protein